MDSRIYVITHRNYIEPTNPLYRTLHVGRALSEDLGYEGDDTGDQISNRNRSFCELTGMYWIWKNVSCDIVGICHYRRYFVRDHHILTEDYIVKTLEEYDIIAPNSSSPTYTTNRAHYAGFHYEKDLDTCREVIARMAPDYLDAFDLFFSTAICSFCNMLITRKEIYDKYCEWLFPILFEVERRTDISSYDTFQARLYGYLAERLFRIWIFKQPYRIREEEVLLIDPQELENSHRSIDLKKQYLSLSINDLISIYSGGQEFDMADLSPLEVLSGDHKAIWLFEWNGYSDLGAIAGYTEKIQNLFPGEDFELHVISFENLGNYITLPDWIIEKFNSGHIDLGQLTDIIKFNLLYRYGGLWIVEDRLDNQCNSKHKKSLEKGFEKDFYSPKYEPDFLNPDIANGEWDSNYIVCSPGHRMLRFVLNALYMYWAKEDADTLTDERLSDYMISIARDIMPG